MGQYFRLWLKKRDCSPENYLPKDSAVRFIRPLSLDTPPMIVPSRLPDVEVNEDGHIAEKDLMKLLRKRSTRWTELWMNTWRKNWPTA